MGLLDNVGGNAAGMGMGLIGQWASGWINKDYNEEQAEIAEKRKRSLMEWQAKYNSPVEQMKRLKEAGLNPAMLYGQSGATGTMSDVQAPQANVSTNDGVSGMGIQLMMAQKQMQLIDSQINKNNVEANKTQGVDTELVSVNIKNVMQDTNNKGVLQRLTSLQADYQEVENMYQKELTEANIKEINAKVKYINQDTERLLLSNDITRSSKNELIRTNFLNNAMLLSNIAKNSAQINEIKANIDVLKSTKDYNIVKTQGEKLLNIINGVEAETTKNTGMKSQTGELGVLVNGLRAGLNGFIKLLE